MLRRNCNLLGRLLPSLLLDPIEIGFAELLLGNLYLCSISLFQKDRLSVRTDELGLQSVNAVLSRPRSPLRGFLSLSPLLLRLLAFFCRRGVSFLSLTFVRVPAYSSGAGTPLLFVLFVTLANGCEVRLKHIVKLLPFFSGFLAHFRLFLKPFGQSIKIGRHKPDLV